MPAACARRRGAASPLALSPPPPLSLSLSPPPRLKDAWEWVTRDGGVLSWLPRETPPPPPLPSPPPPPPPPPASPLEKLEAWARRVRGERGVRRVVLVEGGERRGDVREAALYVAEAVCPWDYDRKEPALTFVNVWHDVEAGRGDRAAAKVKLVSTINPLRQSWKVTGRTSLYEMGRPNGGPRGLKDGSERDGGVGGDGAGGATGGIVFGKAGLYLVGDVEPYVGVEADRVVSVPRLQGTSLFFHANFRSSRKPEAGRVLCSAGVQQTVNLSEGFVLTLRVGANSRDGWRKPFASPVPFGRYF